jgi:hypothetical protein
MPDLSLPTLSSEEEMPIFGLFDSIMLTDAIILADGDTVLPGTDGAVVEILEEGEAYLVEIFGNWVKFDDQGDLVDSSALDTLAFRETLDVVTVTPEQIKLVKPATETVGAEVQLLTIVEQLPQEMVAEVVDFAQFLQEKTRRRK